jgi:hypothetical protein
MGPAIYYISEKKYDFGKYYYYELVTKKNINMSVHVYGVGLKPLDCWDRGFESR